MDKKTLRQERVAYMTKDKTLYVSDLDGTLLNKNAELSEYTANALNRLISRGISFTVATGRTTDAAKKIMADINLNIPIISFHGAIIYDAGQKNYVKVYGLAAETVGNIIAVLKSYGFSALMYEFKSGGALAAYYEPTEQKLMYDFIADRTKRFNSTFVRVDDFGGVPPEHIMYFALGDIYDRIKPVYDALRKIPGVNISLVNDTYGDNVWYAEAFSKEASKQNAVEFLRETYGYKKIIGFGDNYNDLPMFNVCDVRVAVKNARDEVKAAADYICEPHDEDGVVKWIENNII